MSAQGRDPSKGASARIPSLDGLRAISISIVMLSHLHFTGEVPGWIDAWGLEGRLGVDVFFVISGYLITRLLMAEETAFGSIDLLAFYKRRIRRIVPALFVFVGTIAVLDLLGVVRTRPGELASAIFYYRNFLQWDDRDGLLGQTWSLAVEEHFYLLWPCAFLLLGFAGRIRLAVWVMGSAVLVRLFILFLHPKPMFPLAFWTPCCMDTIMAGCCLALWTGRPGHVSERGTGGSTLLAVIAFLVLVASRTVGHHIWLEATFPWLGRTFFNLVPLYRRVPAPAIEAACIAVCMNWCIRNPASTVGNLLNWRPIAWVGTISYSLYLWHVLFFAPPRTAFLPTGPVISFAGSILLAAGSYYLIEKPFLRIRVGSRHDGAPSPAR